jgi:hypothetical protein
VPQVVVVVNVTRAALMLAGLIVGWVAFVLGACVAFIAADTWVARKYRRNGNAPVIDWDRETAVLRELEEDWG